MDLNSSAALQQLRRELVDEQSTLKKDVLQPLVMKVTQAQTALETARGNLNTVKSSTDNDVQIFNTARMEFFLGMMAKDGMIWDSFEQEFFPNSDEIYYAVELKIGARLNEDDFVETLYLHQTPNRETRDFRCYSQPAIGCVVPVIMVGELAVETAPDNRCSKKLWEELWMRRGTEARQKLSNLHIFRPSGIQAELAKTYDIPPELSLIKLKDLEPEVA